MPLAHDVTITDAAAIDEDEDEKDEDEMDSAQRAGRQCTYSSTGGGEESREWWNKGAPSVQLSAASKYLKDIYLIASELLGKLTCAASLYPIYIY